MWQTIVTTYGQLTITAVVALIGVITYLLTRRRELAWKRTEFLFTQAQYLDTDSILVEAITILEDRHRSVNLAQVFDKDSSMDMATRKEYLQKFDKLLNFLWRLCYARLETKTLSLTEIEAFGWYFWRISDTPAVMEYCENYGFDEIIQVIKELQPVWVEEDAGEGPPTPPATS